MLTKYRKLITAALRALAELADPKSKPTAQPRRQWIVADHKNWGDHIAHDGTEHGIRRWHGHTTPRPNLYDELVCKMTWGTAAFTITAIRYCSDPPDMWFASTPVEGRILD